jgi:membrane protease YdiL (CAAX protease family)
VRGTDPAQTDAYAVVARSGTQVGFAVVAVAFGLMHAVVFAFSAPEHFVCSLVSIGASGAVWAVVYERTENLAVTAVNHAMSWTVPSFAGRRDGNRRPVASRSHGSELGV